MLEDHTLIDCDVDWDEAVTVQHKNRYVTPLVLFTELYGYLTSKSQLPCFHIHISAQGWQPTSFFSQSHIESAIFKSFYLKIFTGGLKSFHFDQNKQLCRLRVVALLVHNSNVRVYLAFPMKMSLVFRFCQPCCCSFSLPIFSWESQLHLTVVQPYQV